MHQPENMLQSEALSMHHGRHILDLMQMGFVKFYRLVEFQADMLYLGEMVLANGEKFHYVRTEPHLVSKFLVEEAIQFAEAEQARRNALQNF